MGGAAARMRLCITYVQAIRDMYQKLNMDREIKDLGIWVCIWDRGIGWMRQLRASGSGNAKTDLRRMHLWMGWKSKQD